MLSFWKAWLNLERRVNGLAWQGILADWGYAVPSINLPYRVEHNIVLLIGTDNPKADVCHTIDSCPLVLYDMSFTLLLSTLN